MSELSTGTLTFLFTDIEGSTRLWEQYPQAMWQALARHYALLETAIRVHQGRIVKGTGDGLLAAFVDASDALSAALAAQLALLSAAGQEPAGIRVRVAVHTGTALEWKGDYYGP